MSTDPQTNHHTLVDPDGRVIDYLRISVTDRCNERCLYCMPENYHDWLPRDEILTYEELLEIVRITSKIGVSKYRVTGGEPLMRRDIVDFVRELIAMPGVNDVGMTTNATRLMELGPALVDAGLRKINVSLDAVDPNIYQAITSHKIDPVLKSLEAAKDMGFTSVKLNTVLMRGRNEEQIEPLARYAAEHDFVLRFIELMPVSLTEMLDESNFLPLAEAKKMLAEVDTLTPMSGKLGNGPAQYFRMGNLGATVGFIGALTDLHFCDRCNKMRLTCEGKLRPCLGNHLETDLKPTLRPELDKAKLETFIRSTLSLKPSEHLFRDNYQPSRTMTAIGG